MRMSVAGTSAGNRGVDGPSSAGRPTKRPESRLRATTTLLASVTVITDPDGSGIAANTSSSDSRCTASASTPTGGPDPSEIG